MKQVDIHEAKRNLSKLVTRAAKGEPFVIAKAGKPVVKVVAIESPPPGERRRLGFMATQVKVPDDFDRMNRKEIRRLFGTGQSSERVHSVVLSEAKDLMLYRRARRPRSP